MSAIKKLFFVPIGLPGMGKTTLARHLESTAHKSFTNHNSTPFKVQFKKISYDKMLTDNLEQYQKLHPDTPFHHIIDIIRPQADQDYLDAIEELAKDDESSYSKAQGNVKEFIYLDRNNTPDVWGDISKAIKAGCGKPNQADYKSILILPKQDYFNPLLYNQSNPISPQFIYECIKRIFARKSHDCLSSANKPKVIEVILKFAKLYDGVDFGDEAHVKQHFDNSLVLEFMKFSERLPIS
jgi:hypothetical protein